MAYMELLPEMVRDIHNIFDTTQGIKSYPSSRNGVLNDGLCTWSQCDNGLILQYSYGTPSEIITPYGNLRISGDISKYNSECIEIVHKRVSDLLSLSLYKDLIDNEYGSRGPWYRITNYRGMDIPTSNLVYPVTIEYQEAKRKFNSIFN